MMFYCVSVPVLLYELEAEFFRSEQLSPLARDVSVHCDNIVVLMVSWSLDSPHFI